MNQMQISGIPRPNLDLALDQAQKLLKTLESGEQTLDTDRRIQTLRKWIAVRKLHPIVPAEYRPEFRGKKKPPLGPKHPGPNFNFPFRKED